MSTCCRASRPSICSGNVDGVRNKYVILTAERITGRVVHHGEGPFWDDLNGRLLCTDLLSGVIVGIDAECRVIRHQVPSAVASVIRRRASGGFVIGSERGVLVADEQLSVFAQIAEITGDREVRTNDGGCDRLGNLIIGTMAYDERPGGGAVYRVTADHQVVECLSPVSISNGTQWSADGNSAYYIDTPTRRVDVFNVDPTSGAWSGRQTHIIVDEIPGLPDGMAIDDENGLWIALWGGGSVNHYDAAGRLVEKILVPGVSQVTSCAFGGDDLSLLYITTSRLGLADDAEPDAGAVFAVRTRSRGAVLSQFAG